MPSLPPHEAFNTTFVRGALAATAGMPDSGLLLQTLEQWLGNWLGYFEYVDPIEEGWDWRGWEFHVYLVSIFCVARDTGGSQFLRLQVVRNARRIVLSRIRSQMRAPW